jgi:flagellar motility protein MotE (MotC chaperone)
MIQTIMLNNEEKDKIIKELKQSMDQSNENFKEQLKFLQTEREKLLEEINDHKQYILQLEQKLNDTNGRQVVVE